MEITPWDLFAAVALQGYLTKHSNILEKLPEELKRQGIQYAKEVATDMMKARNERHNFRGVSHE